MGFKTLTMAVPPYDVANTPASLPGLWRIDRKNVATTWVYLTEERLGEFRASLKSDAMYITQMRNWVEDLVQMHLGERNPINRFCGFCLRWIRVGDDAGRIRRDVQGTRVEGDAIVGYENPDDGKRYGKLIGYSIGSEVDYLEDTELNWCTMGVMMTTKKFGDGVLDNVLAVSGITENDAMIELASGLFQKNQIGSGRSPGNKA